MNFCILHRGILLVELREDGVTLSHLSLVR